MERRTIRKIELWGIYEGGVIAGCIAGFVMLLAMMIRSGGAGVGFTMPLKLIAASVLGTKAAASALGVFIVGALVHFFFSALFGVVFAALHPWQHFGRPQIPVGDRAVGAGGAFSLAIWAAMTYMVLPLANPMMRDYTRGIPISWLAFHLLYGLVLVFTPKLRRRYAVKHAADLLHDADHAA